MTVRSHPEGSIAESYLAEESMTFCSRFLQNVETKSNRPDRYIDGFLNAPTDITLTTLQQKQLHQCILFDLESVEPYRNKHLKQLKVMFPKHTQLRLENLHFKQFADWFKKHMSEAQQSDTDLNSISRGPSCFASIYSGYIMNGLKFQTSELTNRRSTQNNGIFLSATTSTYAKSPNDAPLVAEIEYHGLLENVFEICYGHTTKYCLFECKWYDPGKAGTKVDDFGVVSVNTTRGKFGKEPFILANQAQQCFYIQDPVESEWSSVLKIPNRDIFDVDNDDCCN